MMDSAIVGMHQHSHPVDLRTAIYELAKRTFDLTLAILGILLCAPLFAILAILIKLDSPGPVLFRGTRIGRFGVPFRIFKLRTMVAAAEQLGGSCTSDEDPRITRIGTSLRKLKLDELPQLFNVLEGSMSFVGPRPEVKKFTDLFSTEERHILDVRPGITDWATMWDADEGARLSGSADPEQTYTTLIRPTKISLQLEYIRKRSFWTDVRILSDTIGMVLQRILSHCTRLRATQR